MNTNTLIRDFGAARRTSTPIVVVTTADQWEAMDALAAVVTKTNGGGEAGAVLTHDVGHGLRAYPGNDAGETARAALGMTEAESINPVAVLLKAESRLPPNSVIFMINAHRHFADMPTRMIQAVSNVRDAFKLNKRMVVLLCHAMTIPKELEGDVVMLDDPLPTADRLSVVVTRQHENAKIAQPSKAVLDRVVAGCAGLPKFAAEQVVAMSIQKTGIDLDQVWERKRKMIENTAGLSVYRGKENFASIGGYTNIKAFFGKLIEGPNRPDGVVFIDEIEKDTAGMKGDNTGIAQKQHKSLLTFMQNSGARGVILAGQPGAGKSLLSKALGNEAGVPTIELNLGDLQASLVGASEELMRNALKTVQAVCQGRALFIATCNDMNGLSPELRGRFKNGTFFFDLPTAEERELIWQLYLTKYNRKLGEKRPNDDGWVGREIEACCDQAYSLGISLVEASAYIVPQAVAMRDAVERRRQEANGAIISASYAGTYQMTRRAARSGSDGRTIEME